jgi:sec-independent protein translocase protein TatA
MNTETLMIPALFDLSTTHLIIIAVILLLLFGAKLPSIMRGLGSSVNEFKKGMETPSNNTNRPITPTPPADTVHSAESAKSNTNS